MSNISSYKGLDPKLTNKVEALEKALGANLWISSGVRTKEYNQQAGGAKDSQHLYGRAVDIARSSFKQSPEEAMKIALELGFTGVGFYDKHIHLDVRTDPHKRGYSFWDNRTGKSEYDKGKFEGLELATKLKDDEIINMGNDKTPVLLLVGASALIIWDILTNK